MVKYIILDRYSILNYKRILYKTAYYIPSMTPVLILGISLLVIVNLLIIMLDQT